MPKKPRAADDAGERFEVELEKAGETAGRYARKILDETDHLGDSAAALKAAIRAEPIKYSAIALGVGAIVGMLLRRR